MASEPGWAVSGKYTYPISKIYYLESGKHSSHNFRTRSCSLALASLELTV